MGNGLKDSSIRFGRPLTRREALKTLGLTGLGMALLSACGQQAAPQSGAPAASKPAEAGTAAAGAPKDGGTFRLYLHTENAPTLDPYLNVSFRVQEPAACFYSRLLMSKKGPGVPGLAYIMEGDLAESWKVGEDG